jgi:signal transduction histidine kinase
MSGEVYLTADGTVLAVTGGAPTAWVGIRIDHPDGLPAAVRDAARRVLQELHSSTAPTATSTAVWPETGATIQVIGIEAIPLRRVPTDLRSLLSSAVETMRRQAESVDVGLRFEFDQSAPPTLSLDPGKMAWAVTALVGSALRHVRHGSRRLPGGQIIVRETHDAGAPSVAITVEDDGPGIPSSIMPFLFDRAPGHQVSLGLALGLVREIIAAHGGTLDVESRTDGANPGTTIRMTLPVFA